jgi:YggT family protein
VILLANALVWAAETLGSVLWLLLVLALLAAILPYVLSRWHPMALTVEAMAGPLLRPARRLLLRPSAALRLDLAPWVMAVLLWLGGHLAVFELMKLGWSLNPVGLEPQWLWVVAVRWVLWAYTFCVLLVAVMSWFRAPRHQPWVRFLEDLTAPGFRVARFLVPSRGLIDFSPLVLLVLLRFADRVVLTSLAQYMAGWS